jgi:hypothetical protein
MSSKNVTQKVDETSKNVTQKVNEAANQASGYAREVVDRVGDIGERVQSNVKEMGEQVRSRMDNINVDEATVPDAFRGVPKLISPRVHSWLDLAVTSYFVGIGIWFAVRGKGRAAASAFLNAGMVGAVSAQTDYYGTGEKPINFKMHGTLDAVQATTAAMCPVLFGFAGEPEAKYFFGQAGNEAGVIATTDWDAGMPAGRGLRAA